VSPADRPFDARASLARDGDDADALELDSVPARPRGATRLPPPPDEPPAEQLDPRRPVRIARGINALLVVLALVGSVQVVGLMVVEVRRLLYSEGEIARLESEIDALERDSADLRAVAEREGDERYRELLARRQGYVFPTETRFIGPPLR